jgi:hypothetical protein
LQRATIIFVMSVCLSFCPSAWNKPVSIGRIFIEFSKICRQNSSYINIWKNT